MTRLQPGEHVGPGGRLAVGRDGIFQVNHHRISAGGFGLGESVGSVARDEQQRAGPGQVHKRGAQAAGDGHDAGSPTVTDRLPRLSSAQ